MASISVSSYTFYSVTFTVSGISSGNTVRFYVRLYSDTSDVTVDSTYTATSTSMTKTFDGLEAGTTYAYNYYINGTAQLSSAGTFTTRSEPYFSYSSVTSSSVTVSVYNLRSGYEVRFAIRKNSTSTTTYDESYTATSTSMTKTFDGLDAGTYYVVNVQVDSQGWIGAQYFTTSTASSLPAYWSWYSSNGSATATQTSNALNAINNNGAVSNFSYLVWNDLVDKVYEIIDYVGGSWRTTYASYSSTRMTSSDKALTATRYNSLRYNLYYYHSDVGWSTQYTGYIVYGYLFHVIGNGINDWLDSL